MLPVQVCRFVFARASVPVHVCRCMFAGGRAALQGRVKRMKLDRASAQFRSMFSRCGMPTAKERSFQKLDETNSHHDLLHFVRKTTRPENHVR